MTIAPEVIYHYTTGDNFRSILKDKGILPTKSEPDNPNEIPSVTFSTDPNWENTRCRIGRLPNGKLIMMTKELLKQFCQGLIRIVVPASVAPMDWKDMKDRLGMSQKTTKGIYDFALKVGSRTRDWYATTDVVTEGQWIAVQKLSPEGEWIDLSEDEIPDVSEDVVQNNESLQGPVEIDEMIENKELGSLALQSIS